MGLGLGLGLGLGFGVGVGVGSGVGLAVGRALVSISFASTLVVRSRRASGLLSRSSYATLIRWNMAGSDAPAWGEGG